MKKRYHNSILRNTVNFNHFSLNTISELQEGLQKKAHIVNDVNLAAESYVMVVTVR